MVPSSPLSTVDLGDEPSVFTADEVARLLRVNIKTVYDAVRRGELPGARRIGNTLRFGRGPLMKWLNGA
jgi:excisionase family DNA binding protein